MAARMNFLFSRNILNISASRQNCFHILKFLPATHYNRSNLIFTRSETFVINNRNFCIHHHLNRELDGTELSKATAQLQKGSSDGALSILRMLYESDQVAAFKVLPSWRQDVIDLLEASVDHGGTDIVLEVLSVINKSDGVDHKAFKLYMRTGFDIIQDKCTLIDVLLYLYECKTLYSYIPYGHRVLADFIQQSNSTDIPDVADIAVMFADEKDIDDLIVNFVEAGQIARAKKIIEIGVLIEILNSMKKPSVITMDNMIHRILHSYSELMAPDVIVDPTVKVMDEADNSDNVYDVDFGDLKLTSAEKTLWHLIKNDDVDGIYKQHSINLGGLMTAADLYLSWSVSEVRDTFLVALLESCIRSRPRMLKAICYYCYTSDRIKLMLNVKRLPLLVKHAKSMYRKMMHQHLDSGSCSDMLQMLQSYSALLFACNLPLMMKLRAMDSDIAWKVFHMMREQVHLEPLEGTDMRDFIHLLFSFAILCNEMDQAQILINEYSEYMTSYNLDTIKKYALDTPKPEVYISLLELYKKNNIQPSCLVHLYNCIISLHCVSDNYFTAMFYYKQAKADGLDMSQINFQYAQTDILLQKLDSPT